METPTPEQVQRHISAAFDSVSLIEDIIAGTRMQQSTLEDRVQTVERNVGHLNIMVAKDWFTEGMTEVQATQLNAAISAGDAFVAANQPEPAE